ncbi:hypothetical protein VKT23_017150 [Stygiomarasmius scandens]|uniref:Protein kinase domain-containing protein n=1 Tax=Marasmiellus scandens TaxID=2682957 RepID=A0ABR1ISP3_9AGAR
MNVPASTPGMYAYPHQQPSDRGAFTQSQYATPLSKCAGSQADFEENHKVEHINVYLEEDICDRVCVSESEFLSHILDLTTNDFKALTRRRGPVSQVLSSAPFQRAWEDYIKTATKKEIKEPELYPLLISVMNAASKVWFPKDSPLLFFDGSGKVVLGSYASRKPDIHALDSTFAVDSTIPQNLDIYWPMIMWWLEVKCKGGNALDHGAVVGAEKRSTDASGPTRSREIKPKPKKPARASISQASSHSQQMTTPPARANNKRKIGGSSTVRSDVQASSSSQISYSLRSKGPVAGPSENTTSAAESHVSSSPAQSNILSCIISQQPNDRQATPLPSFGEEQGSTMPEEVEDDIENDRGQKRLKDEEGQRIVTGPEPGTELDPAAEVKLDDALLKRHTQLQCAGYGLEMLSSGLLRLHSVGVIIDTLVLQLVYYDRSKVILSKPVKLSSEYGQAFFLAALYKLMSLEARKQGLLPASISMKGPSLPSIKPRLNNQHMAGYQGLAHKPKHPGTKPSANSIVDTNPGCNAFYDCELTLEEGKAVKLKEVVYRAHGIIGRGTTVIKGVDWNGQEVIVKFSFPSKERDPENELVEYARGKAVGDHAWAQNHLPEIRWAKTYDFADDMPQTKLAKYLHGLKIRYDKRVLRITVQDVLHPLTDLVDSTECAQVFYDVLQTHRWLVDHAKILHRDISMANVMFRRIDGRVYGVLNDFDLASKLPPPQKLTSLQRTGTKPFMALDLLNPNWEMGHGYRHDLESLFYVVLIFCCHYDKHASSAQLQKIQGTRPFDDWFTASTDIVRKSKADFFLGNNIDVTKHFHSFKVCLTRLKKHVAAGYTAKAAYNYELNDHQVSKQEHQTMGIPFEEPPPEPFEWITLGDNITYEKFKQVMGMFMFRPLITRYPNHLALEEKDFLRTVVQTQT